MGGCGRLLKWKQGLIKDHITGDDDLIGGVEAVLLDLSKLSPTWPSLWSQPKPNMFWPIHEPYWMGPIHIFRYPEIFFLA